jgi:predicted DNA binding CopG/RHH family protein
MSTVLEVEPMPKRETMPVRLGTEAMETAKIAASLKGMSLSEYATHVLLESANRDIDEFSKARVQGTAKRTRGTK